MLLSLRVLIALTAVSILVQATTMGIYLSGQDGMLSAHVAGAMVTATLTLVQAVVGFGYVLRHRGSWTPAVIASIMFAAVMVQMAAGFAHNTALHLPPGLLLFGASIWFLTWTWSARTPVPGPVAEPAHPEVRA